MNLYSIGSTDDLSACLCLSSDVTVENLDVAELGRLLQLVLGCAVNCEDKQGIILYMNEFMNCTCIVIVLLTQF